VNRQKQIPRDITGLPFECRKALSLYSAMVAEFRVTIFAPELKGGMQVSEKKLKLQWQTVQSICPGI